MNICVQSISNEDAAVPLEIASAALFPVTIAFAIATSIAFQSFTLILAFDPLPIPASSGAGGFGFFTSGFAIVSTVTEAVASRTRRLDLPRYPPLKSNSNVLWIQRCAAISNPIIIGLVIARRFRRSARNSREPSVDHQRRKSIRGASAMIAPLVEAKGDSWKQNATSEGGF